MNAEIKNEKKCLRKPSCMFICVYDMVSVMDNMRVGFKL